MTLSMRCQCLDRGCIQDVLFRFGSLKTVLIINKSCSEHFLRSRRPLLLHLPTPSEPITPSQVWWSVRTLALKSPRRMSLSVRGVAEIILSNSHIELIFHLIRVGHRRCIDTDDGCMFIARQRKS